ncbi:MAG: CDP-alcohol phosphatidyltransferase family protein [Candidatus Adiutrix sp.]|jgi:CDP-diacylglycerol--serine O-phosphatidyltransferase|nr:CDP-alcohol phosphatidyltransferase family protein [Candidatus Adiutrix sp.]
MPGGARPKFWYLLPNLFTALSLLGGFYAILASVAGHFIPAAWAILLAALCDSLDGTLARLTRTSSLIGGQLDSLCDLIAFGIAPIVMAYFWGLTSDSLAFLPPPWQKLGAVAAFIYLACGTYRLARFNVNTGSRDPSFFQGLPITGGAASLSAAVLWVDAPGGLLPPPYGLPLLILTLALAGAMVSNLDYLSHKHQKFFAKRRPWIYTAVAVVLAASVWVGPTKIFPPLLIVYLLSGPAATLLRRRQSKTPAAGGKSA